jgi:three-Cys-motif partner protein
MVHPIEAEMATERHDAWGGFDEIGIWSEIKLEILEKYARAYSTILSKQQALRHAYIDAFAGAGVDIARETGEFVRGSPLNALAVSPPFRKYFFIDLDRAKTGQLRNVIGTRDDVEVLDGDCNELLLREVLPSLRYDDYWRALCVLDPYGLHLDWRVLAAAGSLRSIEIFLNFPVMDINRNALWRVPRASGPTGVERMNRFWGDDSWKAAAYANEATLFGPEATKRSNEDVVEAFQKRLIDQGGFKYVPEPLPMRIPRGPVVYYLFFASQKPVAAHIVTEIFSKYRRAAGSP